MADPKRVAGRMTITQNGSKLAAAGAFSYDLGFPKREGVVGPDAHHGYKEMPKVSYIEGLIVIEADTNITSICTATAATIILELATGKLITLGNAYYAGDNTGDTDGGTLQVRFEGMRAEEI